MKILLVFIGLMAALPVFAGGMRQIPARMMALDNEGRTQFIENAAAAAGLAGDQTVRYSELSSVVLTGDEGEGIPTGGVFHYRAVIDSSANDTFRKFVCSQQLAVGNADGERFTRPVDCSPN